MSADQAMDEIETALLVAEDYADFRARVAAIVAAWREEEA